MGKLIYAPTIGPEDWRRFLADPEKQWKPGYSARVLAECWEAANGWPPEVAALFLSSAEIALAEIELLIAIPEFKVNLPPRGKPSQNDLFVLGKAADNQLVAITIEGKVGESFGPTLGRWNTANSPNKEARLHYIAGEMGLPEPLPSGIRYQLLHRMISAVLMARKFNARYAIMMVHSFSPTNEWFEDFRHFISLFGVTAVIPGILYLLKKDDEVSLYAGWARGDGGNLPLE